MTHNSESTNRAPGVLFVLTRFNIGGPATQFGVLARDLKRLGYRSMLAVGDCEPGEEEMSNPFEPEDSVVRIPEMSRSVNPWRNLCALVRIWRLIRRMRPDVVHTHTAMAGCLGRVAAFLAGVPVIVHTFHGNSLRGYFSPLASQVFLRIERLLARVTDTICVVSEQQLSELSDVFRVAPRSRFRVMRLGLDLSPFTAMPAPSLDDGRLRVGWFGRLVPVKNIPLLVGVIEATLASAGGVEFHIAGDGPERESVLDATRRFGSRVVWHGWQRDIAPLVNRCHVLLQTSLNEGTPVALIQGMAAARPFVSTPAGGVVDMVSGRALRKANGCAWYSNGVLADPEPAAFARALLECLASPAQVAEMGRQARIFATSRYKQETLLAHLDSLYRELLETRKRPRAAAARDAISIP